MHEDIYIVYCIYFAGEHDVCKKTGQHGIHNKHGVKERILIQT